MGAGLRARSTDATEARPEHSGQVPLQLPALPWNSQKSGSPATSWPGVFSEMRMPADREPGTAAVAAAAECPGVAARQLHFCLASLPQALDLCRSSCWLLVTGSCPVCRREGRGAEEAQAALPGDVPWRGFRSLPSRPLARVACHLGCSRSCQTVHRLRPGGRRCHLPNPIPLSLAHG